MTATDSVPIPILMVRAPYSAVDFAGSTPSTARRSSDLGQRSKPTMGFAPKGLRLSARLRRMGSPATTSPMKRLVAVRAAGPAFVWLLSLVGWVPGLGAQRPQ